MLKRLKAKKLAVFMTTVVFAAGTVWTAPYGYGLTTKVAGVEIPDKYKEGYEIVNCLDISKYQKDISADDWEKIKDSGVGAVIIRAGYSSYDTEEHKPDVHFEDNIVNAFEAGLDVGVYYFSAAVNKDEAKAEAKYFVDRIEPYRDMITLPVVMDLETNQRGRFTASVIRNMGTEKCTEMCEAFLDVVEDAGYDPMLYASRSVLDNNVDHERLEKKYKIWLAQYPRSGQAPSYDGEYFMWQYSSNVRLEGIDARVDANYLFREDASATAEIVPISLYADEETSDEEISGEGANKQGNGAETAEKDRMAGQLKEAQEQSRNSKRLQRDRDGAGSDSGDSDESNAGKEQSETDATDTIVSFNVSDGVSSEVPVYSDSDSSTVTVKDKSGYVHEYKLYKAENDNQTETLIASLFNGYFTSKHDIDPEFIEEKVLPAVFGDKYVKNTEKGKSLSMKGMCTLLEKLGLKAVYREEIGDYVYKDIKTQLIKGKPVIIWMRTNNEKWGVNKRQMLLLVGMDESGYAIMVDPVDRSWSKDDQRVKLVSVTELVSYMRNSTGSDKNFTGGADGGYILVDK